MQAMEDIEDLLIGGGGGGGAPPGYRLPLTAVGIKPKKKNKLKSNPDADDSSNQLSPTQNPLVPKIPGTQVSLFMSPYITQNLSSPLHFPVSIADANKFLFDIIWQTIYVKTFGCSHNQASPSPLLIKLITYRRIITLT